MGVEAGGVALEPGVLDVTAGLLLARECCRMELAGAGGCALRPGVAMAVRCSERRRLELAGDDAAGMEIARAGGVDRCRGIASDR